MPITTGKSYFDSHLSLVSLNLLWQFQSVPFSSSIYLIPQAGARTDSLNYMAIAQSTTSIVQRPIYPSRMCKLYNITNNNQLYFESIKRDYR